MNPSLAYTVLAMQKAAQTPPVNNNFLPMAGAGVGYMMGDGDMTDRLLPAGIGYFLANAYNNMTPEQRANLFAKSPELAQQAQQAATQQAAGTIPEIAPGAAGAPDVHAKIRPSNLPANATLHHVQVGNNTQGVWKVVGADGTQQLFDSGGKMLQQGSPVYTQAAAQIQSGQAPATYAGLPENVKPLPTGLQPGVQTITTQSGTYQVEKLVDKNGKPIVDKNGIQKAKFSRVDANGALVGDLTQSELADVNRAYAQGQAKITPAPKMTPGKGYVEAGRGEWYNPKTQDVRVLDPKQGLVSVQPGNPDYDRIRNTASGIPQGAKEHINPLTGQKIMVVPEVTPGVTGVSSPTVESYRVYEIDKTKPGWKGNEITNPYARQTINAELVADYNKPQTQSLTEEYRRLEATKPLPRDYAKAKLGDPESIAKIREHELAVANARTKDININRGAAQPKSFKGNFFGKPVEIKNPLRSVESRMNLGTNVGKATGAVGGFAGGALLGGMAGKGIANALGGEDDQEFGAITGSILGGLAGGYGGFKGGERFIGRPLGDSLGQRGPGGTTNKLGETIDPKLLTKSKRFPVGRTLLGLGGAAIAANYFKDWLDKDFDKNETTPARSGSDLSRWMPR